MISSARWNQISNVLVHELCIICLNEAFRELSKTVGFLPAGGSHTDSHVQSKCEDKPLTRASHSAAWASEFFKSLNCPWH